MSNWIMSIVGVICLSALADVVMDDGETKKYVKCVSAIIIFAVIIAPIPKLFSEDFDLSDVFVSEETYSSLENTDFIYKIKEKQLENTVSECITYLDEKGFAGINLTPILSRGEDTEIIEIIVDKSQLVITDSALNININEELKSIVSSQFGVNENVVRIVG